MARSAEQPKVVRLERTRRLAKFAQRVRLLSETGSLTWEQSVIRKMRKTRDFDPQDQESVIDTATVIDYGSRERNGETVSWYTIGGTTAEGYPAKLTVEVAGGNRGTVTDGNWLP
jgi:hypothetical protein